MYSFAYTYRMNEERCGMDAKWFEEIDHEALDELSTIPFGRETMARTKGSTNTTTTRQKRITASEGLV